MNYTSYNTIKEEARKRYMKFLGSKPSFNEVRKDVPNPEPITAVQWVGLLFLAFLILFTGLKAGAVSAEFAGEFLTKLAGGSLNEYIKVLGQVSAVVTGIGMSTVGIIYFTLLATDRKIIDRQKPLKWRDMLTIYKVYPYIPQAVVYLAVIWLIFISFIGFDVDRSLPLVIVEGFLRFLPIVIEVALAELVADILLQQQKYRLEILKVLKPLQAAWEHKVATFETQKEFKSIFGQLLRQNVMTNQYRGKSLTAELTKEVGSLVRYYYHQYEQSILDGEPVSQIEAEVQTVEEAIKPPKGASNWTPDLLKSDFIKRGLSPDQEYTEGMLNGEYASGFGARSAWRNGAKLYFESYR